MNSTNFVKVNTPKINLNAPFAKISTCDKKTSKFSKYERNKNKFLQKRLQMFYILWTNFSN